VAVCICVCVGVGCSNMWVCVFSYVGMAFVMCVGFGNINIYLLNFILFCLCVYFLTCSVRLPPNDNSIVVSNNNRNTTKCLTDGLPRYVCKM
jgi:hypothetical protein